MSDVFFYLFSTLTVAAALLIVTSRNAVTSAMFLIVTFLGMAALFVLLEAYFLAVIQVLVYAGAVVVLFLFIIMLLDAPGGLRLPAGWLTWLASIVSGGLLVLGLVVALRRGGLSEEPAVATGPGANLKAFGVELFTTYLLPMQVTGFLLLVAMVGVIVLSKRFDAAGRVVTETSVPSGRLTPDPASASASTPTRTAVSPEAVR